MKKTTLIVFGILFTISARAAGNFIEPTEKISWTSNCIQSTIETSTFSFDEKQAFVKNFLAFIQERGNLKFSVTEFVSLCIYTLNDPVKCADISFKLVQEYNKDIEQKLAVQTEMQKNPGQCEFQVLEQEIQTAENLAKEKQNNATTNGQTETQALDEYNKEFETQILLVGAKYCNHGMFQLTKNTAPDGYTKTTIKCMDCEPK